MTIIMKPNVSNEAVKKVTNLIEPEGLAAHLSRGPQVTIIGAVGDRTKPLNTGIRTSEGVDEVVAVTEPHKLVSKKFHSKDSVILIGNTYIDPDAMTAMAGPCATESQNQLMEIAYAVKKAGATFLCDSVYKPCTSPYSFQGLEEEGPKYMKETREATGLNVICEITSTHIIKSAVKYVDVLQIGVRNMQNFELLKEAGRSDTPVLLKRGLCATVNEWLNAAKCIISEDNPDIVLYERDVRTYEASTRNTLDVSAVSVIRQKSHLPIIVDPSHATDVRAYVEPLAKVAIAMGTDGLMIEAHLCPTRTLFDGPQSLTSDAFEQLMKDLAPYAELSGRTFRT